MRHMPWSALALVATLTSAFGADTSTTHYRCVQLAENEQKETWAVSASSNGHIAGIADLSNVWTDALVWYRDGVVKPVGMSRAFGVNDLGHMVGVNSDNAGTLWKDGVSSALPALPGSQGKLSLPVGINNKGTVVGYSSYGTNNWHAAIWVDGMVTDLGTLGNDLSKASEATALNRYGDIVGMSGAGDTDYPVFWKRRSHQMVQLPKLTASGFAKPTAINADGLIVGYGTYPGAPTYLHHTLAWTTHGSVTDLGGLPFSENAHANAVNNSGVIVGNSSVDDDVQTTFATVWYGVGQAPVDLNTLLVGAGCRDRAGYRFVLSTAEGVTNNGTIVANGVPEIGSADNVRTLAFRLIPRTVAAQ